MKVEKYNTITGEASVTYEAERIAFTDKTLQIGNQQITLNGTKYSFREVKDTASKKK